MSEAKEKVKGQAAGGRLGNAGVGLICAAVFVGMVGVSFAAVPLYRLFCQVTGYGGTTQRVEQYSDTILDQTITVRFDANTQDIPWDFKPKQREVTLRIGETAEIMYVAHNKSDHDTYGMATYNVSPLVAGSYFNKIQCFCFTEQKLEAGQSYDMPVQFFVDPEIVNVPELKGISAITLSYTFYSKHPETAEKPVKDVAQTQKLGG